MIRMWDLSIQHQTKRRGNVGLHRNAQITDEALVADCGLLPQAFSLKNGFFFLSHKFLTGKSWRGTPSMISIDPIQSLLGPLYYALYFYPSYGVQHFGSIGFIFLRLQ